MSKRIIKNIGKDGVTVEELLLQCRYLQTTIPASFSFSREEISDVVTDTVLKVYKKMQEGVVPKHNYNEFKDYLYICLKRQINQHNISKYRKKNQPTIPLEEIDTDKFNYTHTEFENRDTRYKQHIVVKRYTKILTQEENKIFNDILDGNTLDDIKQMNNCSAIKIRKIRGKIENRINSKKF